MAEEQPKSPSIVERNPLLPEVSIYGYKPNLPDLDIANSQEWQRERTKPADKSTRGGSVVP
jgi:hypothetical protein